VRIEYRYGSGNAERIRKNAAELVALAPDVILVTGTPSLEPLLRETRTVPIVFVQIPDPVGAGFVESLSRPGGNATGFTAFDYDIAAKWLELLKEIAPNVTRVALLRDASTRFLFFPGSKNRAAVRIPQRASAERAFNKLARIFAAQSGDDTR
jgi:putative tryptophan/tyrosine transport system substrate-binding protein